jgi:hypothetical protein
MFIATYLHFVSFFFFNLRIVRGGVVSKQGPHGTAAIYCPIVPAPGDYDDV